MLEGGGEKVGELMGREVGLGEKEGGGVCKDRCSISSQRKYMSARIKERRDLWGSLE